MSEAVNGRVSLNIVDADYVIVGAARRVALWQSSLALQARQFYYLKPVRVMCRR